ncbi:MAG: 16S rRNA (cytosine(1402)-N(4))-methyltransferase RsmH [Patescibacteria group bacterium]
MPHVPVLLKEVIEILNPQAGEFFIDGTIGNAGHSLEALERIGPKGKLLGIDWDKNAIERLKIKRLKDFKNVILVNANYADLPEILKAHNLPKADGLLLDLGFLSEQLESERGFSFLKNEVLDMRYSAFGELKIKNSEFRNQTAAEVVNTFSEKDLADIFYKYGEERYSRRIAKGIIEERNEKKRILTTFDLVEVIKRAVPKNYEKGRINPATRVFQALRIYVNKELENLERALKNIDKIIKYKGRAAIISYHSLEDRLVKNYFRQMAKEGRAEILTKKPIKPGEEEVRQNPRSRSAKLRAIIFK